MRVLDLFSGIGGFSLAAKEVWGNDATIVGHCDIDDYCEQVLAKNFPNTPYFNDVTKLTKQDVGEVDLICGGFPCQDISVAGKGLGIEKEKGQVFGQSSIGSLANYDPSTQLLKMSQQSLLEDSTSFLETLPKQGMMQNGNVLEQTKLVLDIEDKEFGLLPTPTTQESEHPKATLTKSGRRLSKNGKTSHSLNLADSVKLQAIGTLLPTPVASDHKMRRPTKNWSGNDLVSQVSILENNGTKCVYLNPSWVEWLMGYPIGYTDIGSKNHKESQGQQ